MGRRQGGGLSEVLGIPRILTIRNTSKLAVAAAEPKADAASSQVVARARDDGRTGQGREATVVGQSGPQSGGRGAADGQDVRRRIASRVLQIVNGNGMFRELPSVSDLRSTPASTISS